MDTLMVVTLLIAVGYVLACVVWPFKACGSCHGTGRHRSPGGKAWRSCRRCGGSGKRVRLGRMLYQTFGGDRD